MATDLQLLYVQARVGGKRRHGAALRYISRKTGLDTATIARCLHRARRADEQDAKRAKGAGSNPGPKAPRRSRTAPAGATS